MRKNIYLFLLALALSAIALCSMVFAVDLQDLQTQKDNLENQISDANAQISEIQIELTENLQELDSLNQKILQYEEELTQLEDDLNTTEEDISKVTEKLEYIKIDYNAQKKALEKRLVALYEAGDMQYLDVLLSSKNISEFISNYFLISEIAEYDEELLENIEREKNSIESIQDTLNLKKENLIEIKQTKERTAVALENSKILRESYVDKLSEDEKATQKKIEEYQSELNAIENQIVTATTLMVGQDYAGGELAWPAPGYSTITSPFGMRLHPVLKVYRMHTGVDIGMNTGADIVAANDGVVTSSVYTSGYGNMIMIDHGGGVCTVYGHGSKLIAKTGDEVKRGDVIMLAGSTGWSTGPHLHFEVRLNGEYVDPLPYITHKANIETLQEDKNNSENTISE